MNISEIVGIISAIIALGAAGFNVWFTCLKQHKENKQVSQIDLFISIKQINFKEKIHNYVELIMINSGLLPVIACEIKYQIKDPYENESSIGIYDQLLAIYGIFRVVLPKKISGGDVYSIILFDPKILSKIDKLWLTDNFDRKWYLSQLQVDNLLKKINDVLK